MIKVQRCIAFSVLLLLSVSVVAQHYEAGSIHILSPWSRALPPTSENGAAYFTLINHGDHADTLLGVSSPIAEKAEIHVHRMEDGMMTMRHLKTIDVPPGEELRFRPDEQHIMLIHLNQPLKEGGQFPLILHFNRGGYTTVNVVVQPIGAERPDEIQHNHLDLDESKDETSHSKKQNHDYDATTTKIDLQILDGTVTLDNKTVRVTQGDIVELHWSSDQSYSLHLHGYDIKIDVTLGSVAIMRLDAKATGRFPVETHGSNGHNTLIYLEVYPK